MSGRGGDRIAIACVAAGALLRLAWAIVVHPPLDHVYSDMASYVTHAARIAAGADLNRYDVFEPTGTSLLLALPLKLLGTGRAGLWGGAALWAALSAWIPLATWRWARLLFGERAGAWAAGLTAFWPLLVLHSGWFLAETPAMALLMSAVWVGEEARRRPEGARLALLAGVLAGAAVVVRTQLVLNALILLWLLVRIRRQAGVLAAGGLAMVVAAVIAFNSGAAGAVVGLSENGGMMFFQGQCDVAFVSGGPASRPFYFKLTAPAQTHEGRSYAFPGVQVFNQGFFYRQGMDCIAHDGLGQLGVLGRHLEDMLATSVPWPEVDEGGAVRAIARWTNRAMALLFVLLAVAVAALVTRRELARSASVAAAHMACAPLVALVFVGDPRIRLLYAPFALVLLGAAASGRLRASSS